MKKIVAALTLAACVSLPAFSAFSQDVAGEGHNPSYLQPPHSPQQELAQLQDGARKVHCGPAAALASSAFNPQFGSDGPPAIIHYATAITNEGGSWPNDSSYLVPCAGVYEIAISYTSDSSYTCPVHVGTLDDIYVTITRSTPPIYDNPQTISEEHGAFRGQLWTSNERGTGAYVLLYRLNPKDVIQTVVATDGSKPACLRPINFSIHRVSK